MKLYIRNLITIVTFASVLLLTACSNPEDDPIYMTQERYQAYTNIEDCTVVEENDNYKIVSAGYLYYYYILDDGEIVKTEGPMTKQPTITMPEETLVKVVIQGGTGIGTQYGYYYDTVHNIFSQIIPCIRDENKERVVYTESSKVIVKDIFDDQGYYFEISDFSNPFSPVVTPIINAELATDNSSVTVSYLTGDKYDEVAETFILP